MALWLMDRQKAQVVTTFTCQTEGWYFLCTHSAIYWQRLDAAFLCEEFPMLHQLVIVSSDYRSNLFIQSDLGTDDSLFLTVCE